MRIEMWSDVVCPFCWIGKRHLEEAVTRLGVEGEVEIVQRAFQLNPSMGSSLPLPEYLARRFGGRENAQRMIEHVKTMGQPAGLSFDFEGAVAARTFDAHRVIRGATERGVGNAVAERFMRAHFTEGADLADRATLRRLAVEAGLDAGEADRVLASDDAFADEVERDALEAHALGARGVPFFVIDRRFGVAGAQPVEAFVEALRRAKAAAPPSAP